MCSKSTISSDEMKALEMNADYVFIINVKDSDSDQPLALSVFKINGIAYKLINKDKKACLTNNSWSRFTSLYTFEYLLFHSSYMIFIFSCSFSKILLKTVNPKIKMAKMIQIAGGMFLN